MKQKNGLYLILFCLVIAIVACNSSKTKEGDKTTNMTKADTLKTVAKNWSAQDAVKAAEAKFGQYLPQILAAHNAALDVQESHTGDFTGDGLDDVVIYFNLSPKDGGNAAIGQGLVLYKNTGNDVTVLANFEPDYLFTFQDIVDGKIHIEKLDYAPEDGHCCPSIKTPQVLNIEGNKVTASDANQSQP